MPRHHPAAATLESEPPLAHPMTLGSAVATPTPGSAVGTAQALGSPEPGVGSGTMRSKGAAAARPDKDDAEGEEKKIDINFWELSIDKLIDFVLIFIGLYAAIAVQRWQDTSKERDDYAKLLGDFKIELVANRKESEAIAKDLGPVTEREPGKALGPMQSNFDKFRSEAEKAEKLLGCLSVVLDVAGRGRPQGDEANKLTECTPLLEEAAKATDHAKDEAFKPVNLTPFYRDEVKQIYLAGGIKVFENKDLAVSIGQVYTDADGIERLVEEIEKIYNDNFIDKSGEVRVLVAELEDAMPKGDADLSKEQAAQLKVQFAKSAKDVRTHRYGMEKVHEVLELKVQRLKQLVSSMDAKIDKLIGDLDTELAK